MSLVSDTHGKVSERISFINKEIYSPKETAIIILGDCGLNFYLNEIDKKHKKMLNDMGIKIYCVRGNHEERPENISSMEIYWDEIVGNYVYCEHEYPNIKYFMDGKVYYINGWKTLVIGGAYSVDKWYRLSRAPKGAKWTGWFKDEQLTIDEMTDIFKKYNGQFFDYVLTHTCPISWMPKDLFLSNIDQNTVDNTMEIWFEQFKNSIIFDNWKFAHFHDNRRISNKVKMYFDEIEELFT